MLFYFVRHGETDSNSSGLLAGSTDCALNESGHQQAEALAWRLSQILQPPVHRILVSNMTRARETAGYLTKTLNLQAEVVPDFREWHLGEWEGQHYLDYREAILGDGEPRSGESRAAFYGRVEKAWKLHHSETQPYLMVSHGVVWLAIQDLLKIERFKIDNCGLVKVFLQNGRWRAETL
ncbi:MAG: histidine phosphatase family protein [Bdellovibrionales bacterium]